MSKEVNHDYRKIMNCNGFKKEMSSSQSCWKYGFILYKKMKYISGFRKGEFSGSFLFVYLSYKDTVFLSPIEHFDTILYSCTSWCIYIYTEHWKCMWLVCKKLHFSTVVLETAEIPFHQTYTKTISFTITRTDWTMRDAFISFRSS